MFAPFESTATLSSRLQDLPVQRSASSGIFKRWTYLLFNLQFGKASEVNPSSMASIAALHFPERTIRYGAEVWIHGEGRAPVALMRYRALHDGESLGDLEDRYLSAIHDVHEGWAEGNSTQMIRSFHTVLSLLEAHLAYHAEKFDGHDVRHLLPVSLMVSHAGLYRHPELLQNTVALCMYFPILRTHLPALQAEQKKSIAYDSRTWLPVSLGAVPLLRQYRSSAMGTSLFELHESYQKHLYKATQARLNHRPCEAYEALAALLPLVEAELAYTTLMQGSPADLSNELTELSELCVMQEKPDILLDLNVIVQSFTSLHALRCRVEGAWIMRDVVQTLRAQFAVNQEYSVEEAMLSFPQVDRKWVENALRILKRCGCLEFSSVSTSPEEQPIPQNVFAFLN